MTPGAVFAIMAIGALIALVGNIRFLLSLNHYEPELWRQYRKLGFTLEPSYWQQPKLVSAVYSCISHPAVKAARRIDLRCKYVFAVSTLIGALALLLAQIWPILR